MKPEPYAWPSQSCSLEMAGLAAAHSGWLAALRPGLHNTSWWLIVKNGWFICVVGLFHIVRCHVLRFLLKHVRFHFTITSRTTCHEHMFFYFYFLPCITRMLHASDACLSFLMLHIIILLLYQTHIVHALTKRYTHVLLYIYHS